MNNLSKHFSKLVLLFGVILLFIAIIKNIPKYISNNETRIQEESIEIKNTQEVKVDDQAVKEISPIVYQVEEDNQNAFELLKENAQVEYKEYDFGVFVESINGITGDDKHFWSLYVNNEQSMTGADQTTVNKGDTVEWRYTQVYE